MLAKPVQIKSPKSPFFESFNLNYEINIQVKSENASTETDFLIYGPPLLEHPEFHQMKSICEMRCSVYSQPRFFTWKFSAASDSGVFSSLQERGVYCSVHSLLDVYIGVGLSVGEQVTAYLQTTQLLSSSMQKVRSICRCISRFWILPTLVNWRVLLPTITEADCLMPMAVSTLLNSSPSQQDGCICIISWGWDNPCTVPRLAWENAAWPGPSAGTLLTTVQQHKPRASCLQPHALALFNLLAQSQHMQQTKPQITTVLYFYKIRSLLSDV